MKGWLLGAQDCVKRADNCLCSIISSDKTMQREQWHEAFSKRMCSWFFWLSKIRQPVSSARQLLPPEFPQSFGVDSEGDSAFAYQHLQPVWSCGCGHEATGLRFWDTAGARQEVDSVSLQKLQCSYQTALCFGLSKECTVQIAEKKGIRSFHVAQNWSENLHQCSQYFAQGQYLFHSYSMILFLMSTWQVNGVVMASISYCEIEISACVCNTNSSAHMESNIPRETKADI